MSDQERWAEGLITDRTDNNLETCYCIGPQEGEPYCPCGMRNLLKDNPLPQYNFPSAEEGGVG